jgi:DMSO/TMAO reductase YedYZ molybdopterin-dependent catalytic subunit
VDAYRWRLRIEGAVRKPLEIGYDDLRVMPSVTLTALLECSGNGRVFLKPPQTGIRWELGGVSNAEWTGVRLEDVLRLAGVQDSAVEVILEGADKGAFHEPDPKTPGVIPYARSLSIDKARRPEVILAYRMNDQDLPPEHGFPVRAVIPGWYGMASVKWLTRIIATDRPFNGYFQTFMYAIWERRHGLPTLVPVSDMAVKAEIARPAANEIVPGNMMYRVIGAAWAGESDVTKVELSTDGGRSWDAAQLLGDSVPFAWRFWEYKWRTPLRPTHLTLMARATDGRGHTQPMERDEDRRDAMISHVLPVEVRVQ